MLTFSQYCACWSRGAHWQNYARWSRSKNSDILPILCSLIVWCALTKSWPSFQYCAHWSHGAVGVLKGSRVCKGKKRVLCRPCFKFKLKLLYQFVTFLNKINTIIFIITSNRPPCITIRLASHDGKIRHSKLQAIWKSVIKCLKRVRLEREKVQLYLPVNIS